MLNSKTEGFCFGVITVLVAILVLNCLPMKINLFPPAQLGKISPTSSLDKYFNVSHTGMKAETVLFDNEADNMVIIKNRFNKPLTHITGARAVAWSPVEDILLVEKTTSGAGFQVINMANGKVEDIFTNKTFGKSYAKAQFSNRGRYIKMSTSEGYSKRIEIDTILGRKEKPATMAMIKE